MNRAPQSFTQQRRSPSRAAAIPDSERNARSCVNPCPAESGFTLVELLVVLVVIGITLGMTMLQLMPDNRAVLRQEADRLALLLENAELEAQASGRTLAWSGEASHYRFWSKNDYNDWVRIEDDKLFRPRELPDGIRIGQTSIEDLTVKPGDKLSFSSHSYTLPFRISIGNQYGNASIIGKSTGEVNAILDNKVTGTAP